MRGRVISRKLFDSASVTQLIQERGFAADGLLQRMIVNADDDGRFIADPAVILAAVYPTVSQMRSANDVQLDCNAMCKAGILQIYESGGVLFGQFLHWFQHQCKPDERYYKPSKYPAPRGFRGHWTWGDATRESRENHARITRANTRESRVNPARNSRIEVEVEVGRTSCLSSDSKEETESSERPRASRKKRATASGLHHQQIIDHIHDTYETKTATEAQMPFKQIAAFVKQLRKTRSPEQIKAIWDHWLSSEDPWAKEHAWAWNQFQPNFNAVELALKEGRPYGRTERTAHKRPRLDTLPDPPEAFGAGGPFKL